MEECRTDPRTAIGIGMQTARAFSMKEREVLDIGFQLARTVWALLCAGAGRWSRRHLITAAAKRTAVSRKAQKAVQFSPSD